MTKSKTQTISSSILTEKDLKKIQLVSNDGKDTPTYFKFTNDLEDNPKKGIYLDKIITPSGRKMGLEIYQTATGCEDVYFTLKPYVSKVQQKNEFIVNKENDLLEIEVGSYLCSMMTTTLMWNEDDDKDMLIDLIKSMVKHTTSRIGNPIYIK
jgi:hypothetical protein